jgi:hypothetical protein
MTQTLISAGAGLFGAIIGVIGTLVASRRAEQTARQQRLQEQRYGVVTNVVSQGFILLDAFVEWLKGGGQSVQQQERVNEALKGLAQYLRVALLWLPNDVNMTLMGLYVEYGARFEELSNMPKDAPDYKKRVAEVNMTGFTRTPRPGNRLSTMWPPRYLVSQSCRT